MYFNGIFELVNTGVSKEGEKTDKKKEKENYVWFRGHHPHKLLTSPNYLKKAELKTRRGRQFPSLITWKEDVRTGTFFKKNAENVVKFLDKQFSTILNENKQFSSIFSKKEIEKAFIYVFAFFVS